MFAIQIATDNAKQKTAEICVRRKVNVVIHHIIPVSVTLISVKRKTDNKLSNIIINLVINHEHAENEIMCLSLCHLLERCHKYSIEFIHIGHHRWYRKRYNHTCAKYCFREFRESPQNHLN